VTALVHKSTLFPATDWFYVEDDLSPFLLIFGIKVLQINLCAKCGKILGKFSARARELMFSVMSPFCVRVSLANRCCFVANVRM
jgi:hypothetical protein